MIKDTVNVDYIATRRKELGLTQEELGCVGKLKITNKSGKKNEIQEANIKFIESA